jgi:RNA polymerase sigma-70 factor, ECF subfamily
LTNTPRPRATQFLTGAAKGEPAALAGLTGLVYEELRGLAAAYIRRERTGHSLQPTALVHEAFLRLIDAEGVEVRDKRHFFAIAANTMRRVLVEHARARNAAKRGGGVQRVTLAGLQAPSPDADTEVVALDEALERLAQIDPRQARIVELRFFGGLTVEEVAESLGLSKRTVEGDWALARAWLLRELTEKTRGSEAAPP